MAYTADYTLSQDSAFRNRIQMALVKAAVFISNEAAAGKPITKRKRHDLATIVLNFPASRVEGFTQAAIEASGLTSGSTDAQIDTAIASVWNGMADVKSTDV